MCPARIECQSEHNFTLKKGEQLGKQSIYFDELPWKDKECLIGWMSIYGTKRGYKLAIWGLKDVAFFITPHSVTSLPSGHEKDIQLEEGNVFTLPGGTRVIPFEGKNNVKKGTD